MARRIPREVRTLACEFHADVGHRRALGDRHAEYHAQRPKNRAYKKMLDAGFTAKQAVRVFRTLVRGCR